MYTHLEDYIYDLYKSIGITTPEQLDMLQIARKLGVEIIYRKTIFRFENEIILVPGTTKEEWMDFGHELCHYLRHCGNQANLHPLFIELQEWQAENFTMHFCVPTFMLRKLKLPYNRQAAIYLISSTFNVDLAFAEKRLNRYINKLYSGGYLIEDKRQQVYK